MKSEKIIDALIQEPKSEIVIELSNGQRISSNKYIHSTNKWGDPIIVITAGRKISQ